MRSADARSAPAEPTAEAPASPRAMIDALCRPPRALHHGHFYSIDFARGIAALFVLLWHYQHFFFPFADAVRPAIPFAAEPLYGLLRPAYTSGYLAVNFFWLLSGFVFAAVYATRPTTTRDFTVNRVARLYPLHLVTLLTVAALQFASVRLVGHQQIYAHNDPYHFVLQLFFASHWGLERGFSFNGPIWSVSIEVLVYALFWLALPFLFRRGIVIPLVVAAVGWIMHYRIVGIGDQGFFLCILYFFMGCAVYQLVAVAGRNARVLAGAASLSLALGLAVAVVRPGSMPWFGVPPISVGVLLLFCAVEAAGHGHRFHIVRWIGDNKYGTYLWHVPIQIALLIGLDYWVGDHALALQPWFLAAFVVLVVVIARLSFVWIEAPARERIRRYAKRRGY